ncbi:fibrous sheath-interacting protein 2-like isoform X2 [Struthio camelus]|uniref:fibrous sheath-interacting protein 2-like isoform X2 n=1 Tax=Struthio camelus TaxID=8801 RepID=UPI003603E348
MIAPRMEKLEALEEEKGLLQQAEREQQQLGKKKQPGSQKSSGAAETSEPSAVGKKTRRAVRTSVLCGESWQVMVRATWHSLSSEEEDATRRALKGRPEEECLSSSKLRSWQEAAHQELESPEGNRSEPPLEAQDTDKQESSREDSSRELCLCPETSKCFSSGACEGDSDADLKESRRFWQRSANEGPPDKVQTMLLWTTVTEAQELEEVAESVVKEVLGRVKELDQSVCVLRRAPLAISGPFFGRARGAESSERAAPDLQQEIGGAASEIVATVLDSFGKHLVCSTSDASERGLWARQREQLTATGAMRAGTSGESSLGEAELPPLASLDKIARDAVERVGCTLESFVASQFQHHFQGKFSEILKLPLETLSERQLQPSCTPFSSQATKEVEGTSRAAEHRTPEATKKRKSPVSRPVHKVAAGSQESSTLARASVQNAISEVQQLHSELKVYAQIAVHDVLEALKQQQQKLDKEMHPKDSSEESTTESELAESLLDQCSQPESAIALGGNCGRWVAKQPSPRDWDESYPGQDLRRPEGRKIPARKLGKSQPRTKLPHISLPGMVMPSEAEGPSEEELSRTLLQSVLGGSEQDAQSPPEGFQKPLNYPSATTSRLCTSVLETLPKQRPGSMQDALPTMGQQFSRQPVPPATPKPPSQRGARRRPMRVRLVPGEPEQWESGETTLAGRLVEGVLRRCAAPGSSSSDSSDEN